MNIDLYRAQIMSALHFITLDVFTSTRFLGNPLAIVHVPNDLKNVLSQTQKQTIAREFNLSETVFMQEGSPDGPITIEIFTTDAELPFAGHPSIGSGWYFLSRYPAKDRVTLRTKAGDIPVVKSGNGKVRLQIPIDFKAHPRYVHPRVKVLQPQLNDSDYINGLKGPEAVASIVKGMTFLLLQLTSEDALARLLPPPERLSVSGLGEWDGFVGLYFFYKREDGVLRTRMFDGPLEDPATGSAAATLASWLAKERGQGVWTFHVVQGVEMGRRGEVEVMVGVDAGSEVERVELGGSAVEIMEGTIRTGHEA
jgi:PhzF family phenazine biosynthesis protein